MSEIARLTGFLPRSRFCQLLLVAQREARPCHVPLCWDYRGYSSACPLLWCRLGPALPVGIKQPPSRAYFVARINYMRGLEVHLTHYFIYSFIYFCTCIWASSHLPNPVLQSNWGQEIPSSELVRVNPVVFALGEGMQLLSSTLFLFLSSC